MINYDNHFMTYLQNFMVYWSIIGSTGMRVHSTAIMCKCFEAAF